jgi:hypothetical protein
VLIWWDRATIVLGRPTVIVDIVGSQTVVDSTFDPPGPRTVYLIEWSARLHKV